VGERKPQFLGGLRLIEDNKLTDTFLFQKQCMYQTLLTSLEEQIFIITINRPDKLNAINNMVMSELSAVIDEVYHNAEIRSAIITGAGPKAFVAGADISEFEGLTIEEGKKLAQKGQDVFQKIEDCPKPVVAAVNGFALGGGHELAMACHFRIASENAKFGQPEVNLGLIPGYGGTQRLVQLIGKGCAIEMMITGNMIDANTALQLNLVNYVVPQNELLNRAKSILAIANSKAPLAISKCIEAANAVFNETKNGYQVEMTGFGECFATEDMKEGTAAFLEKRKAVFKGK
jgi:enoyl-CoA hydratase